MAASYLVVLFCATAGQNGEDLGADEEQIVLFVYLLYDVANNKVSCEDRVQQVVGILRCAGLTWLSGAEFRGNTFAVWVCDVSIFTS